MAIPKYETVMLPLLELLADGQVHKFGDLVPILEDHFALTPAEREEMLPSGRVTTFRSRVHWAATYMTNARLVQRPQRGWLQMSPRGRDVLAHPPKAIDIKFLNQFSEFVEYRTRSGVTSHPTNVEAASTPMPLLELSPEETLENSYQTLRAQVAEELLDRLKTGAPKFFEQVVVDLLVAMGYGGSRPGVVQAIGRSGDGGIDGIIKEDKLGLDVVHVQAKRWQDAVGRPVVQAFSGSLDGQHASKGVLITTSKFTNDAWDYVKIIGKRIVLIDGETLAGYMIDHNVGVTSATTYVVKKIDNDYFDET